MKSSSGYKIEWLKLGAMLVGLSVLLMFAFDGDNVGQRSPLPQSAAINDRQTEAIRVSQPQPQNYDATVKAASSQNEPSQSTPIAQSVGTPAAASGAGVAGGAPDLRVSAPGQRTLKGTLRVQKLMPVKGPKNSPYTGVDVVHVMDISGSMMEIMGGKRKIDIVKAETIAFNGYLNFSAAGPTDQVALVTYPKVLADVMSYIPPCPIGGTRRSTLMQTAEIRALLSNAAEPVNTLIGNMLAEGFTPLANGIQKGRNVLERSTYKATNLAVMIVASDGIANFQVNGEFAGVTGITPAELDCLALYSIKDAIDQANLAKADNNADGKPDTLIFSIALGLDFNPAAMQAIASSSKSFYVATDSTSLQQVYAEIARQLRQMTNNCQIVATEAFVPNTTIVVQNRTTGQTHTLTTNSIGEFSLANAAAGVYEFQAATTTMGGVTYDVFTAGVGGSALASKPTVEVRSGNGVYSTDLALRTNADVNCH